MLTITFTSFLHPLRSLSGGSQEVWMAKANTSNPSICIGFIAVLKSSQFCPLEVPKYSVKSIEGLLLDFGVIGCPFKVEIICPQTSKWLSVGLNHAILFQISFPTSPEEET